VGGNLGDDRQKKWGLSNVRSAVLSTKGHRGHSISFLGGGVSSPFTTGTFASLLSSSVRGRAVSTGTRRSMNKGTKWGLPTQTKRVKSKWFIH